MRSTDEPRAMPHMSRRLALALALVLTLGCAGHPVPDLPARDDAPASASPLLWRATRDDTLFYLFGSVHVGDAAVASFWPSVQSAFDASEEIVMEVDLEALDPGMVAEFLATHGILDGPETLETRLSPAVWRQVEEHFASAGVDTDAILPMQPWLLLFSLMGGALAAGEHTAEQGVESIVTEHARTPEVDPGPDGALPGPPPKPIVALESAESQLHMFASLDDAIVEGLISRTLDPEEEDAMLSVDAVLDAWRRGDAEALGALLTPDDPVLSGFYERIVFERNDQMTERLTEMGADGRTRLVIVGVLHMLGPRGIPSQLAKQGFAVELLD